MTGVNVHFQVAVDGDDRLGQLMGIVEVLLARLGGETVITDAEIEAMPHRSELNVDAIDGGVRVKTEAILDG